MLLRITFNYFRFAKTSMLIDTTSRDLRKIQLQKIMLEYEKKSQREINLVKNMKVVNCSNYLISIPYYINIFCGLYICKLNPCSIIHKTPFISSPYLIVKLTIKYFNNTIPSSRFFNISLIQFVYNLYLLLAISFV